MTCKDDQNGLYYNRKQNRGVRPKWRYMFTDETLIKDRVK